MNPRQEFLRSHWIERADIEGIGEGRTVILQAYGISDAADVSVEVLRGIPGIGEATIKRLVDWRAQLATHFEP